MFYQTILRVVFVLTISCWGLYAGAQTKTITGQVLEDSLNTPVPGVTIKVKNGPQSAVTNIQGSFTMNIPSGGATLQYSHIGYEYGELRVDPSAQPSIKITLKRQENKLDEVVVIGYGTQKRENLTGSVATVDLGKISDYPVSSIAEALKGQIPGLTVSGGSQRPGENATLSIRQNFGFSKDGNSQIPLIIIDDVIQLDPNTGQPTLDQFNNLDPSQVESITVLRDAAAAIYGARASQGAIIVKTKRGKIGAPKISYAGKFETNDAVSFGKVMNAYEYGVFANRFGRNSGWTTNKLFDDAELEKMKSLNYDWLNAAWKPGSAMQHSLDVSGGSERATYFAGAAYYTQKPNMGSQDYNKWSFRSGVDVKVLNNLKFSATVAATNSVVKKSFTKISLNDGTYTSQSEQTDYAVLLHMPKYIPWQYTVAGQQYYVSPALGPSNVVSTPVGQNNIAGWNYFAMLDNGSFTKDDNQSYQTNFSLQYDVPFVKGLSLKASYGLNYMAYNNEQAMLGIKLGLQNLTNQAGYHLYQDSAALWVSGINNNRSTVRYSDVIGKNQQMNFFVNYDRKFGRHSVSAMASVEKGQQDYQKKFMIYDVPIYGAYNGSSPSAGTLNISNSYVYKTQLGNLGYLGRINYDYDNRYLLQLMFRSDASTKFAPENYWGFFPGVSAGWVVSRENWFANNVNWVNFLKIRGSIAKTGKDNLSAWRWMQTFGYTSDKAFVFGSNGGALTNALSPDATPNRNVRWDGDIKKNIGIDLSVLNNRLTLTYDKYWDYNYDLLMSMAGMVGVPVTVGGGFAEQNYGILQAWGSELSATWKDKVGNLGYSIGVNFGTGDNKIKKWTPVAFDYPANIKNAEGSSTILPSYGYKVWKETSGGDGMLRTDADIDAYWQYLTDRATAAGTTPAYFDIVTKTALKKGMLAYQDLGGVLNTATNTIAGPNGQIKDDGQDKTVLVKKTKLNGFTTNLGFTWKSFMLNAQIATSWGGYTPVDYLKQPTSSGQMFYARESYLNDMYDSTDNPNGKYPNLAYYSYNGYQSDFWQISSFRSFVRSMVIGYTLPANISKKLRMSSLRVSLAGFNLWDFYNPYPDKYRNMYDSPKTAYPTLRTWSFGINASF
ncbi:SusC/RagA family TonB-linked outer membrane protein [Niabella sp.]|uniref:SusC/RagA family TonB-linked outer membrane protein n=1 Tax=Niabella sp. TaxID=1962976 RepID=UPI00261AACD0|nr:SusC/RagA family TonB-linked outer membrane protein [Niabella sp.]